VRGVLIHEGPILFGVVLIMKDKLTSETILTSRVISPFTPMEGGFREEGLLLRMFHQRGAPDLFAFALVTGDKVNTDIS